MTNKCTAVVLKGSNSIWIKMAGPMQLQCFRWSNFLKLCHIRTAL